MLWCGRPGQGLATGPARQLDGIGHELNKLMIYMENITTGPAQNFLDTFRHDA
jgi:hypothetical protein